MSTRGAEPRLPRARAEGLLSRPLPDGVIVYDTERHRAHSLNRSAALIWQFCDGHTPVAAVIEQLGRQDLPAHPDLVWLALDRLEKAHLLAEPAPLPASGISRRAIVRKLGLAGGLAALLPLVDSLSPPPARAAASGEAECVPAGRACSQHGAPCCDAGYVCTYRIGAGFICTC